VIGRSFAAAVCVLACLAAALAAQTVWIAAGALDADRFAAAGVAALRAPEGREALAAEIRAAAGVPSTGAGARVVDQAVAAVVGDPAFPRLVRPGLAEAHRSYLRGDGAALDLEPVRAEVARRVTATDAAFAAGVPPPGSLGTLRLADSSDLAGLERLADVGEEAEALTALLAAASLILLLLALVVSRRPAATAAVAGVGFLALAALALAARAVVPPAAAEDVADPVAASAVERLGEDLIAGAVTAAAVCGLTALVLFAGAAVAAARRR
jgi:hypothetical protein